MSEKFKPFIKFVTKEYVKKCEFDFLLENHPRLVEEAIEYSKTEEFQYNLTNLMEYWVKNQTKLYENSL